jgi:DNA-binding response OmpR family regulator
MKTVLILDDEEDIRGFIVINLKRAGYRTLEAATGEEAQRILEENSDIDVAVLDVMLPGIDGMTLCRKLRRQNPVIGILMLTAKTQEQDRIQGLMGGADDYVAKPFSPSELVARIDALYRRVKILKHKNEDVILCGSFRLDLRSRLLHKGEDIIELTQVEYLLMKYFMENQGAALSRDELLNAAWGINFFGDEKIVDVNIRRLRQKIERDPSQPRHIQTVWGLGYKWSGEDV